jgi:tape measure domain-containing protein
MIVDYARLVIEADSRGVRTAADDMDKLSGAGSSAQSVFTALKPALLAVGSALSVRQIIDYTDRWTDLNSRLLNATKDSNSAGDALGRISDVARRTYSSLETTANAFLRNSTTLTELGYSTSNQLDLMEALNNALVVSGTKGQQAESVMDALSKAFAFGELRGQNFNTVIQSGGRIVEALADGLGVTTLELRSMAADGLLPTSVVVEALTSQLGKLREEADRMPATVSDGFLLLKNAIFQAVGTMDQASNGSSRLAGVLVGTADAISNVTDVMSRGNAGINVYAGSYFRFNQELEHGIRTGISTAKTIEGMRTAVSLVKAEIAAATELYGANSRQVTELQAELVKAESRLINFGTSQIVVSGTTEELTESTEDLAESTREAARAAKEHEDALKKAREEIQRQQKATDDLISSLYDEIRALDMSSLEIKIQTALRKAGTNATDEEKRGIEAMVRVLHEERETRAQNAKAVEVWTAAATNGARQRAEAEKEAARQQQEMLQKTHEFMTKTLLDIWDNSDNVFKKIGDSFVAMVKRMVAEWAASKLMNLVGMGGPSVANPFAAIASSTAGQAVSSIFGGGTAAAGTAAGGGIAGAGASLASAAGSVGSAISGGVAAVGTAVKGAASGVASFAAANPILAGVAVAALVAKALETKPTPSTNAGLLIHDAAGVSADRKFAVSPFDSGFQPIGFARREDQSSANQVIDAFRQYDSALTEIARAAGLNVNFSNNPFGGFDEKGQGNGLFLGVAAEAGKPSGASLDQQLTHFTKQWVEALGGQVAPDDRAYLLSAASADDLIKRAAELGSLEVSRIHGSHYNGLDRVPFNGYVAQLHQGERVLTASEADAMDRMGLSDMVSIMKAIAQHTAKTARQLERWNFDGLPEERVFA